MCEILNTFRLELKSSCSCYEETSKEIISRASNTYAGLCYTGRSHSTQVEAMPIVAKLLSGLFSLDRHTCSKEILGQVTSCIAFLGISTYSCGLALYLKIYVCYGPPVITSRRHVDFYNITVITPPSRILVVHCEAIHKVLLQPTYLQLLPHKGCHGESGVRVVQKALATRWSIGDKVHVEIGRRGIIIIVIVIFPLDLLQETVLDGVAGDGSIPLILVRGKPLKSHRCGGEGSNCHIVHHL